MSKSRPQPSGQHRHVVPRQWQWPVTTASNGHGYGPAVCRRKRGDGFRAFRGDHSGAKQPRHPEAGKPDEAGRDQRDGQRGVCWHNRQYWLVRTGWLRVVIHHGTVGYIPRPQRCFLSAHLRVSPAAVQVVACAGRVVGGAASGPRDKREAPGSHPARAAVERLDGPRLSGSGWCPRATRGAWPCCWPHCSGRRPGSPGGRCGTWSSRRSGCPRTRPRSSRRWW